MSQAARIVRKNRSILPLPAGWKGLAWISATPSLNITSGRNDAFLASRPRSYNHLVSVLRRLFRRLVAQGRVFLFADAGPASPAWRTADAAPV